MIMANLSAHKPRRVRELIQGRGCEFIYLPPYSPDLNLIEEAFSKIKRLLCRAEARTGEALTEAMDVVSSAISSQDAQGFFEHCRYHLPRPTAVRSAVR